MASEAMPSNVYVSRHPCTKAKVSILRSRQTNARETKALVHEIALLVGCEALGQALRVAEGSTDRSPIGYDYVQDVVSPARIAIMPIMRSGLAMLDAIESLLPQPVPVYHLGLYRDKTTMSAVEYYNNLRNHGDGSIDSGPSEMVILVDPVIATGATACAAIQTLQEWGVQKVLLISVIASRAGISRAAAQWPEGVTAFTGAMDEETDSQGMLKPGLGDIGDRLFLTLGK